MHRLIAPLVVSLWVISGCTATKSITLDSSVADPPVTEPTKDEDMQLGNFSISLTVKDIAASRAFYEKLGFEVFGGEQDQNWLIMRNDTAIIGLFEGMFEKNIMTFNPGWSRDAETLDEFQDVRDIQKMIKARGIVPVSEADETTTGPASFVIVDPDGNPILIDQHVPRPDAG